MHLQPRIHFGSSSGRRLIKRGEQRHDLQCRYERGREDAEQGEPISTADQEVEQHDAPADEDEHLKEIREGTSAMLLSTQIKKRALEGETQGHGRKMPAALLPSTCLQSDDRMNHPAYKSEGGEHEKETGGFHGEIQK